MKRLFSCVYLTNCSLCFNLHRFSSKSRFSHEQNTIHQAIVPAPLKLLLYPLISSKRETFALLALPAACCDFMSGKFSSHKLTMS